MKTLTIDEILAAEDTQIEAVSTPAWGGQVFLRTISGDKRDAFDAMYSTPGVDLVGVRARFVGACLCNEKGEFLNPTENQIKALGKKNAHMLDRCFDVAQRLNGMRASDVAELEKNSRPADENGSG